MAFDRIEDMRLTSRTPSMIPAATMRSLSPTSARAVAAATAAATAYSKASTMVNHFVPAPPATAGAHQRTAAQQQQPFIHPRDREFMAQTENAPPNQETVPGGRCAKWHFVISNSILLVLSLAFLVYCLSIMPRTIAPDTIALSAHDSHVRSLKSVDDDSTAPRSRSLHDVAKAGAEAFQTFKQSIGIDKKPSAKELISQRTRAFEELRRKLGMTAAPTKKPDVEHDKHHNLDANIEPKPKSTLAPTEEPTPTKSTLTAKQQARDKALEEMFNKQDEHRHPTVSPTTSVPHVKSVTHAPTSEPNIDSLLKHDSKDALKEHHKDEKKDVLKDAKHHDETKLHAQDPHRKLSQKDRDFINDLLNDHSDEKDRKDKKREKDDDIDTLLYSVQTNVAPHNGPTVDPIVNIEHFRRDPLKPHFLHADALLDGEALHTLLPELPRTQAPHEVTAQLAALNREAQHLLDDHSHVRQHHETNHAEHVEKPHHEHDHVSHDQHHSDHQSDHQSEHQSSHQSESTHHSHQQDDGRFVSVDSHLLTAPTSQQMIPVSLAAVSSALALTALLALSVVAFYRLRLHRRCVGSEGEATECRGANVHYVLMLLGFAVLFVAWIVLLNFFDQLNTFLEAFYSNQISSSNLFGYTQRNVSAAFLFALLGAVVYCLYGSLFSALSLHSLSTKEMHRDVESTFPQHPGAPSYTPVHHTPEHVAPAHLRIPFSLLVIVALIAMLINVTVLRALGDEDDRWPIYKIIQLFALLFAVALLSACLCMLMSFVGFAVSYSSPSGKDKNPHLIASFERAILICGAMSVVAFVFGLAYYFFLALPIAPMLSSSLNCNALIGTVLAFIYAYAYSAMQEWIEYCELVCQYLAVKAHRDALTM